MNISRESQPAGWVSYPGGIVQIGHAEGGFSFDNERPRHRQYLEPFQLATRPVSNAEFLEFIEDGGYERPALWLAEGYDWLRVSSQITRQGPLYWRHDDGQWREFTLHGLEPLAPGTPVSHVSYYEADAYARWRNARLPTEAEWEYAADGQPVCGNFADNGHYHPRPAEDVEEPGLHQLYGDVWEWTQSSYSPYPGFKPAAGSTGEYNGKFMVNQYVLRGGSCASAASHIRPSYRNFFPASACWQFSGIRLARDTV